MKRHHALAVLVGMVLMIGTPFAQQKSDFSGRWVMVSPSEGAGQEQVVKQDATTLRIGPTSEGPPHVFVYKLDGTENRAVLTPDGSDVVSKASWTGNQLTITSTITSPDGRKLDQRQVWSLDGEGRLVIEVQLTRQSMAPMKTTMVYRKR